MTRRLLVALVVLSISTAPAASQSGPAKDGRSSFDFMIGDWDVIATPKVNSLAAAVHGTPRLHGIWHVAKTGDGTIEDELRITDESGNPTSQLKSKRRFDDQLGRWMITETDVLHRTSLQWSAQGRGSEIVVTAPSVGSSGDPYTARTRLTSVSVNEFRALQDRSYDGGRQWGDVRMTIEAQRTKGTRP